MRSLFSVLFLASINFLPFAAFSQNDQLADIRSAFDLFSGEPSDKNRRELLDILEAYEGPPTVATVNAHLIIMMHDAPSNKFRLIAESAGAAKQHLEPISETLPKQYWDARFMAAIARFNAYDEADSILEMAHVRGATHTMRSDEETWQDWAKTLHYRAYAWTEGMQASRTIKGATKTSIKNKVEDILSRYPNPTSQTEQDAADGLPWCEGEVKFRRKPRYPTPALSRGKFGSVVIGFGFDRDGKATNVEVLASVPLGTFDKETLKWARSGYFKPENKEQVGVTCRVDRPDIVQTLTFSLG